MHINTVQNRSFPCHMCTYYLWESVSEEYEGVLQPFENSGTQTIIPDISFFWMEKSVFIVQTADVLALR